MISFGVRVERVDGKDVQLGVFAGPDADHRAKCGQLYMNPEEAMEFILHMGGILTIGEADIPKELLDHWHVLDHVVMDREDFDWLISCALGNPRSHLPALDKINDKYGASATRRRIQEARARS